MDQAVDCRTPWDYARRGGCRGLMAMLLVIMGLMLVGYQGVVAAAQPDKADAPADEVPPTHRYPFNRTYQDGYRR